VTLAVCPPPVGRRNSGRMLDSDHMSNFGHKIWLRSYIPTPLALFDSGRCHDSGRISWLRSMSMPHILPPQLWKTLHGRVRWQHHLANQKFSRKQTGRDAWLDQRSKHQYLTASHAQVVSFEPRDQRALNLGWSERNWVSKRTRYPCNSGGSRSSNAWSGKPSLYVARPWH
jgi:hypothetical protein